ncbi:GGDEF domain-containing protein [Marinibaculum pumilum]|uniref:diguanylate cyclase n=1 Tax=Marinibaculum pumilum TaxID=1766165 RepID=A0ABV7KXG2_9PROT
MPARRDSISSGGAPTGSGPRTGPERRHAAGTSGNAQQPGGRNGWPGHGGRGGGTAPLPDPARDPGQELKVENIRTLFDITRSTSLLPVLAFAAMLAPFIGSIDWIWPVAILVPYVLNVIAFEVLRDHYRRHRDETQVVLRCADIFAVLNGIAGCLWSAMATVLLLQGDLLSSVYLGTIIVALGVSSAISRAAFLPAVYAFVLPLFMPLILFIAISDDSRMQLLGLLAIMVLGNAFAFAHGMYRRHCRLLQLKLENVELVDGLGRARDAAERARREARESEHQLRLLSDNLPGVIIRLVRETDGSYTVPFVSAGVKPLLGVTADDVVATPQALMRRILQDDRARVIRALRQSADTLGVLNVSARALDADDDERWLSWTAQPRPRADGAVVWEGAIVDITERHQLEEELRRLAMVDSLTGVANRRHFEEMGERELSRLGRVRDPLCVLLLDADHFKRVNDRYGHHVGDIVLRRIAEVCTRQIRTVDAIGRLGGEEFGLLLPNTALEGARVMAERIRRAIAAERIVVDGETIRVTVSIGGTQVDPCESTIKAAMQRADEAMYRAKQEGRNRVAMEAPGLIEPPANAVTELPPPRGASRAAGT